MTEAGRHELDLNTAEIAHLWENLRTHGIGINMVTMVNIGNSNATVVITTRFVLIQTFGIDMFNIGDDDLATGPKRTCRNDKPSSSMGDRRS
jgi:hypothetical protein